MGIKFFCPNGHKLNVKSFLSGKKAICPQCGAKVTVPAQSQPAAAGADADDQVTPENGAEVSPAAADQVHAATGAVAAHFAAKAPVAPTPGGTAPAGVVNPAGFAQPAAPANPAFGAWGSAGTAAGFGSREPLAPQSPGLQTPGMQAPGFQRTGMQTPGFQAPATPLPVAAVPQAPAGYGSPAVRDAIDEAPAAVWYVRTGERRTIRSGAGRNDAGLDRRRSRGGDGLGVARRLAGVAFGRGHLSEAGRDGGSALDARATYGAAPAAPAMPMQQNPWGAGAVAPVAPLGMAPAGMMVAPVQAVGAATPAGFPVGQVIGGVGVPAESYVTTDTEDPTTRVRKRRRQQADTTMIVSVILVVLTVVLVIVLVVVLNRQNEPEGGAQHPKAAETAKEKPAAAKESGKKAPAAKKSPAKKTKPADEMEDEDAE